MVSYQLTDEADADLTRILRTGIQDFGLLQAEKYYDELIMRLDEIAQAPLLNQVVDDIPEEYRRNVYHRHSIYYEVIDSGVLIIRILGQQDLKTAF